MGRNGAGKSTTFKALMGLIPQRAGTVSFLGEDISKLKPFEIARERPRLRSRGSAHLF